MTGVWICNGGTSWTQIKRPYSGNGTGYVPVDRIWQQTGADGASDWLNFWTRPTTAPNTPYINVSLVTKTRNKFSVTVSLPATLADGEISRCVVKVGIGTTPNPPTTTDDTYYNDSYNGEAWSEWFSSDSFRTNDGIHIDVSSSTTKEFPAAYQPNLEIPLNTELTFTVWIQDEYGNWSSGGTQAISSLKSTDLPYGGTTYTTVLMPYSFDDWSTTHKLWMYRSLVVDGADKYDTPSWIRDSNNPYWWTLSGGSHKRITYMYYGRRLRTVMNAAYEVNSVKMVVKRRYDTTVNMSGGVQVNDADLYGAQSSAKMHVWACNRSYSTSHTYGSTSHLITGSDSLINTGNWAAGDTTTITIPEYTWRHFLDGVGSTAYSLAVYDSRSTGSSTDPYSMSFGVPQTYNGTAKWNQSDLSGYLQIEWVGYGDNPWPTADPSHPSFKPLGATSSW